MTDQLHPAARALFAGDDNTPDRKIDCAICGKATTVDGFIVNSIKIWNHHAKTGADLIKLSEIGITCPGECTGVMYRRRHAEHQAEIENTRALLGMLHAGKYNPESLHHLRTHGHARAVDRVLAKEGTGKAHG